MEDKTKEVLDLCKDLANTNEKLLEVNDALNDMLDEVEAERDLVIKEKNLLIRFLHDLHKDSTKPDGHKQVELTLSQFLGINSLTLM